MLAIIGVNCLQSPEDPKKSYLITAINVPKQSWENQIKRQYDEATTVWISLMGWIVHVLFILGVSSSRSPNWNQPDKFGHQCWTFKLALWPSHTPRSSELCLANLVLWIPRGWRRVRRWFTIPAYPKRYSLTPGWPNSINQADEQTGNWAHSEPCFGSLVDQIGIKLLPSESSLIRKRGGRTTWSSDISCSSRRSCSLITREPLRLTIV